MALIPQASNFAKRIIFNGCARPWYVYVETFIPAFIELVLTIAFFDMEDLIRARGEGIVRKGRPGTGRGKSHLARRKLTGKKGLIKEGYRLQLKTLLVITSPLEAIGFAFLVYHAGDHFYGRWQSLLERSDFCTNPIEAGPLTRRRDGGRVSILPGGAAILLPNLQQNRAGWFSTPIAATLPQGIFQAFVAVTVTGPAGGIDGVRLRFIITQTLGDFTVEGEPTSIGEGQPAQFLLDAEFFLPLFSGGIIQWALVGPAVPVGLESASGFFTISRVG